MFQLTSRRDSAALALHVASDPDRDSRAKNAKRWQLPVAIRPVYALGLCLLAWIACCSSVSAQDEPAPILSAAGGAVPLDYLDVWSIYNPRISAAYQSGDGVGYEEGYWRLNSFVPLAHWNEERLLFVDLHALFDENGAVGGNFGIGKRIYDENLGVTVGGYVYYDYRSTGLNQFQQISPGLDVFSNDWEAHINGYLPTVADTRQGLPDQFRGNLLFLNRYESAMRGFDAELGRRLPLLEQYQTKLFVGGYDLQAAGRPNATGWKARLEASVSDELSFAFSVQDDKVFGTTANFGLEFRFSGASLTGTRPLQKIVGDLFSTPAKRNAYDYLSASTRRMNQVVIDREEGTAALDPISGTPLRFLHVAAGGNSDGSFGDPYATLTDALADTRYTAGDIDAIYVRGGFTQSVTHTGDFNIVDGTHLLSNGPVQTIGTQLGVRMLPFSGVDPLLEELPQILGRVGLGNDTTLSGFDVLSTTDPISAILADGVTEFNINNNVALTNRGASGILLTNIDGRGLVLGNRTNGNSFGIAVASSSQAQVNIIENESRDNATNGINIFDSTFKGDIAENMVTGNGGTGISIEGSYYEGTIAKNTSIGNFDGIGVRAVTDAQNNIIGPSTFIGDITNNTTSRNQQDGILVLQTNMTGGVTYNTVQENARSGIEFFLSRLDGSVTDNKVSGVFSGDTASDPNQSRLFKDGAPPVVSSPVTVNSFGINFESSVVNGNIARNITESSAWSGIFVRNSIFTGDIRDNETPLNGADGIAIYTSTFNGNIENNSSTNNFYSGIYLDNTNFTGNVIGNTATANIFQGILVAGFQPFQGAVTGNSITDNFNDGLVISVPTFTGNISNNLSRGNGFSGITLFVDTLNTTISDNFVASNGNLSAVFGTIGRGISVNSFTFDFNAGNYVPGTFNGDIVHNTVLANFGVGIEIDNQAVTGSVLNNISSDTNEHGIFISDTVTSFTGDIRGNTTNNDGLGGIGISTPIFTGDIANNIANFNAGSGGIEIGGFGLPGGATSSVNFTGDITGNTTNGNTSSGGILFVNSILNGNIVGNTANDNTGGNGIEVSAIGAVNGNIAFNVANGNALDGLYLHSTVTSFTGDIANNQTNNNQRYGIEVFATGPFMGNIADNVSNGNAGYGIGVFNSVTTLTGSILGNTANLNGSAGLFDGIFMGAQAMTGDINGNTANQNTSLGILGSTLLLNGEVSGNAAGSNGFAGIGLVTFGNGVTNVSAEANMLSANNLGGAEFGVINQGAGTLNLFLSGNSSANAVPAGQFNYDLQNNGGGFFNVFPAGVNALNFGTVGSSNNSVTTP